MVNCEGIQMTINMFRFNAQPTSNQENTKQNNKVSFFKPSSLVNITVSSIDTHVEKPDTTMWIYNLTEEKFGKKYYSLENAIL